jgi:serine/threonine-protein kinase
MPEATIAPGGHPTPAQLADFGRGAIDGPLAEAIERHLQSCAACVERLESSPDDDPWIALLRAVGPHESQAATAGPTVAVGYELEELIGRGGMGVVHRARQLGLDRRVAIKTIAAGRDASPEQLQRFRREFEAVARLNDPAIVRVYDVGIRDGVPYYAMELLEGGSLSDRLAAGPLGVSEAATLVERLARAIEHAHRQGVIHRDLKPSNILFDREGQAKVADFGLARRLDPDPGEAATRSSMLLGTPSYMAPEQAAGRPDGVGAGADVYALGVLLYECLAGRPPFVGTSPLETLELIRTQEAPGLDLFRPGLPVDLRTICQTCLEKDPSRRYATAAALADDLGRFLRREPIAARPAGRFERAVKWARRRPAEAAFVALLGLSVVGTIVGLLAHQSRLRAALTSEARAAADARTQRALAESNYRDARDAMTQILSRLGEPRFAGSPRLTELYREQAEAALTFYDRVLGRAESSSPTIRRDTARAAVEAANLQITLGRTEPADANLVRAQGLYASLLASSPKDGDLIREQMVTHIKLGVLLMRTQTERSVAALEAALVLARRRAALLPTDDDGAARDLAWCEHNLGAAWQLAGHNDRAAPHYARCVSHYEAVLKRRPDDVPLGVELAQSLINLGLIDGATGQTSLTEAHYARAETLLDAALTARPGVGEYVATWSDLQVNRGNLDVRLGRTEAGIERLERGLRELRPILEAEPENVRLRATAINLHGSRAMAMEKVHRYREAADDWSQVGALSGPGAAASGAEISRLLCLARAGEHRVVGAECGALLERNELPAIDAYNLACALAVASEAAQGGSADQAALRAQAVGAFQRAVAGDPGLRETARQDADLRPLAEEPAFRQALEGP